MANKTTRRTPPTLAKVWLDGLIAAAIAVAAIIVKSQFDHRHGPMHHSWVAWIAVPVLLISGIYAVGRLADGMGRFLARRQIEAAGAIVRLIATGVGYLLVLIAVFELLGVSIAHLIIGFGLAGVVLGIAAQQSLGNIFASLVLIFARPFGYRGRAGRVGPRDRPHLRHVANRGRTFEGAELRDPGLRHRHARYPAPSTTLKHQ
jgi:small-conductance mechanosensitive channel